MTPMDPPAPHRLTSMLIRLPPQLADQLRELSKKTRVRQSEYLREAVRDLLAKYAASPEPQRRAG